MQNFTTQEHQRTNQGNVVVENPGKTIAKMRAEQQNRNIVNGIVIAAMALTVVITGTMLGATTAHNNQLKKQIRNLETQNTTTLSQRVTDTPQQQPVVTIADNPTLDNLARPYTGRKYYHQYYKPQSSDPEHISEEKADAVELPKITVKPAPATKVIRYRA